MFLLNNLKSSIQTGNKVDCPILGCERSVDRQPTNDLKREPEYYCPDLLFLVGSGGMEAASRGT